MNKYFITLFNYNYLPQGLTMYYSLKSKFPKANLWVLCMDKKVEKDLKERNLPDLNTISLENIENKSLLSVKKKRKFIEYCWTITSFLPSYFFNKFKKAKTITYLDADIFFFKSPKPIINEFLKSKKSIFITEHGFHPKFDFISKVSGKFCVQYMIFKNNIHSKRILHWWQKKCLEWCHDFPDKGRFGDQKYLDNWPILFKKYVHVSKNKKYFQGPWSFNRFKTDERIIYHFHGLKINLDKILIYNRYGFTKQIINRIYLPYCRKLKKTLEKIDSNFSQSVEKHYKLKSFYYYIRFNVLKNKLKNRLLIDIKQLK